MDSQFSQFPNFSTQYSQYSGEASEFPTDDAPKKKGVGRGAGFNIEEDRLLIGLWLNTSLDAVHGNEQKLGAFWERVEEYYHNNKQFPNHQAERLRKRKMKQTTINEPTPVADLIQKMIDDKKERDEKKLELLKQKIEQDEKKVKLKKIQMEMEIMSMDTSNMSEEQQQYYASKKT
ncbi:glutathione S-transferase T3-like protein [Cinnamomum micranthum f. kanehirae]|uniref:Glutathione S-transferase T3-like protein n=1 Tax=Cinnamomum micranthum f. kanehirae TaxID=337451 RepID=A0A3S3M9Q7_9MAGN|nr:glutathione S-transferase T3-like protein [Cinnamomum micranthum f. kanehirae]